MSDNRKRRGKQARPDEPTDADARMHAATAALRKATITKEHDEGAKEAAAQASDDSWEDTDDENVDERFDEVDEGEIVQDSDDDDDHHDDEDEEYKQLADEKKRVKFMQGDKDGGADDDDDDGGPGGAGEVWRRDKGKQLDATEKLEFANRAYDSFFQMRSEFPCLSFDVIRDNDGAARTKYPLALTVAVGSQASESNANQLYIIRVRNLLRTRHDQGEEDDSEEDVFGDNESSGEDEEDDEAEEVNNGEPLISFQTIRHFGAVNRLRSNPLQPSMIATWSDAGVVQVFDTAAEVGIVAEFSNASREQNVSAEALKRKQQPLKFASSTTQHHRVEGYGLGWSCASPNTFASGDLDGRIFVWKPAQAGRWEAISSTPSSAGRFVEEIQWSPTQENVLIAARAQGDMEVWDCRDMKKAKITVRADATDINVASWNPSRQASHLVVTGAESGIISVWDLRRVAKAGQNTDPIQSLNFHAGSAISSIEFSEHNESVFAATSHDGQCTLWDLSVERDADEEREVLGQLYNRQDTTTLPDQLMFQHQGLTHPKEVHFHPQIPGMVLTGDFNGLNLFKPRNWRSLMK
jgi:ribosome assembly protein RRB1